LNVDGGLVLERHAVSHALAGIHVLIGEPQPDLPCGLRSQPPEICVLASRPNCSKIADPGAIFGPH
jgi:hypothetical protein